MSHKPRRAPAPSRPCGPASKTPRERLTRLSVIADICPQVLLRVLGLLAQRSLVPFTVSVARRPRRLLIAIDFEGTSERTDFILLDKVEAIVSVRSARLRRAAASLSA